MRERIRIDGAPISAVLFTRYFFEVWNALGLSPDDESGVYTDRPPYFRFLALLSFHVFLSEGVDAAVYEVGVGGEYDATNVVAEPAAAGISTLGIDHVATLGHTIEEIAWHKAGILKPGCPAFSTEQVPAAMQAVQKRATEKDVQLQVVGIDRRLDGVRITPDADFQRRNASLAVALAAAVLRKLDPAFALPADTLPREFVDGLEQAVWRGRCETKVEGSVRWMLDGAHTADSLKVAAQWFGGESAARPGRRVLIFNQQGREEAVDLLAMLHEGIARTGLRFDHVVFCTNVTYAGKGYRKDVVNVGYDPDAIAQMTMQKQFAQRWRELDPRAEVLLIPSIEGALEHARGLAAEGEVQALITGSLHLVGGALGLLDGADAL